MQVPLRPPTHIISPSLDIQLNIGEKRAWMQPAASVGRPVKTHSGVGLEENPTSPSDPARCNPGPGPSRSSLAVFSPCNLPRSRTSGNTRRWRKPIEDFQSVGDDVADKDSCRPPWALTRYWYSDAGSRLVSDVSSHSLVLEGIKTHASGA